MHLLCLSNLDQMNDSMLSVTEAFRVHIYGSQCHRVKKIFSPCHSIKAARIPDSGKLFNLHLATFDPMKAICH